MCCSSSLYLSTHLVECRCVAALICIVSVSVPVCVAALICLFDAVCCSVLQCVAVCCRYVAALICVVRHNRLAQTQAIDTGTDQKQTHDTHTNTDTDTHTHTHTDTDIDTDTDTDAGHWVSQRKRQT